MQTEELKSRDVPLSWAVLILALVFVLACVPVWAVKYPPMVDYPMHVARAYLLSLPQNGQGITEFYQAKLQAIPNLGMDLIVSAMIRFVPPLVAGKIFLCVIQLVILTGGFTFSVALSKRITFLSFLPAFALYDLWFMMGFANYIFGIGIAFWGVAVFLWSEEWPRPKRWAVLSLFGVVLAVCHLMALAVAIGCCYALTMKDKGRVKAWAVMLAATVAVCVVAYVALRSTGRNPVALWDRYVVLRDAFGSTKLGIVPFFAVASVGILSTFNRRTSTLVIGLLTFATLGPSMLAGTAFACDRLTLPLLMVVLASISVTERKLKLPATLVLLLVLVYDVTDRIEAWSRGSRAVGQLVDAVSAVPERTTLASFDLGLRHQPNWLYQRHIPDWALIKKPVFVAQNFAKPRQQPMVFQPDFEEWHRYQQNNPVELDSWDEVLSELPKLYEMQARTNQRYRAEGRPEAPLYVLVFHKKDQPYLPQTEDKFTVQGAGDEFTLLKVR